MSLQNKEKNCIYSIYPGDMEGLAEEIIRFCNSRYGEACEFRTVSIHRTQEGKTWELHSFQDLEEALQPIKRHLKARTDSVRVHFGGEEETLQVRLAKGENSEEIARYVKKEDRKRLDAGDYVVIAIDKDQDSIEAAEKLIGSLDKKKN